MNDANEFGFRVGDEVPEGFFDPPSMDEALHMLADYARQNGLTPQAFLDTFSAGILVNRRAAEIKDTADEIAEYAKQNNLTPQMIVDTFRAGILANRLAAEAKEAGHA